MNPESTTTNTQSQTSIIIAWGVMLLCSLLPDILWNELTGSVPSWLTWAKVGLLGLFIILSLFWGLARSLRGFAIALLVYLAGTVALGYTTVHWDDIQDLTTNDFVQQFLPVQIEKLVVVLALVAVLLFVGYSNRSLFLVRGRLDARITPVRWLGFPKPDSWFSFGGQYSVYLALGTGVILWLSSRVSLSQFSGVLLLLPVILVLAAHNAFNEEVVFRSSTLGTLEPVIGKRHAWAISALYFGIAHFWGVPTGWLGILLATFMGWFLAKAMLETRGFIWSWWIHFLQDVVIFAFLAAGMV